MLKVAGSVTVVTKSIQPTGLCHQIVQIKFTAVHTSLKTYQSYYWRPKFSFCIVFFLVIHFMLTKLSLKFIWRTQWNKVISNHVVESTENVKKSMSNSYSQKGPYYLVLKTYLNIKKWDAEKSQLQFLILWLRDRNRVYSWWLKLYSN